MRLGDVERHLGRELPCVECRLRQNGSPGTACEVDRHRHGRRRAGSGDKPDKPGMPARDVGLQRMHAARSWLAGYAEGGIGRRGGQIHGPLDLALVACRAEGQHRRLRHRRHGGAGLMDLGPPVELAFGESDHARRRLVVPVRLPIDKDAGPALRPLHHGHGEPAHRLAILAGPGQMPLVVERDIPVAMGRREHLMVDPGPDLAVIDFAALKNADDCEGNPVDRPLHTDPKRRLRAGQVAMGPQCLVVVQGVQFAAAIAAVMRCDATAAEHGQPCAATGTVDGPGGGVARHRLRTVFTSNGSTQRPTNQACPPDQISPDSSSPRSDCAFTN